MWLAIPYFLPTVINLCNYCSRQEVGIALQTCGRGNTHIHVCSCTVLHSLSLVDGSSPAHSHEGRVVFRGVLQLSRVHVQFSGEVCQKQLGHEVLQGNIRVVVAAEDGVRGHGLHRTLLQGEVFCFVFLLRHHEGLVSSRRTPHSLQS